MKSYIYYNNPSGYLWRVSGDEYFALVQGKGWFDLEPNPGDIQDDYIITEEEAREIAERLGEVF